MTTEPVAKRDPLHPHDRREVRAAVESGNVQCSARSKRTGNRCRRPAMLGGNVCRAHGGNAPQTRAKAQRRLEQAADSLVQRLLGMALDGQVDDPTALRAIVAALDRAGFAVTTKVAVGPTPAFEQIFTGIARGIGRDGKPAPTLPDPPALAPAEPGEIVDAEIVTDPAESGAQRPYAPTAPGNATPGSPEAAEGRSTPRRPPPWHGQPDPPPQRPGTALQTLEDANAELRAEQRRGRR